MSLRKPIGGGDRPLPPQGNHPARLAQVVDLGTQPDDKYGPKPKVRFTFEFSEEKADFGKGVDEPFLISRVVSFARGKKATLPKLVEGVLGRPITDEEYDNLEPVLKGIIGEPCLINVIHARVGDRTFVNVENVTPCPVKLRKGIPALVNKGIYFTLEMGPNSPEFEALPDFLKGQISKCLEWTVERGNGDDDEQQELNFG